MHRPNQQDKITYKTLFFLSLILLSSVHFPIRATEYIGFYITKTEMHVLATGSDGTATKWKVDPAIYSEYPALSSGIIQYPHPRNLFYLFIKHYKEELQDLFPPSNTPIYLYIAAAPYESSSSTTHYTATDQAKNGTTSSCHTNFSYNLYTKMLKDTLQRPIYLFRTEQDYHLAVRIAQHHLQLQTDTQPIVLMHHSTNAQGGLIPYQADPSKQHPQSFKYSASFSSGTCKIGQTFSTKCSELWRETPDLPLALETLKPGEPDSKACVLKMIKHYHDSSPKKIAPVLHLLAHNGAQRFAYHRTLKAKKNLQKGCIDFYIQLLKDGNPEPFGNIIAQEYCNYSNQHPYQKVCSLAGNPYEYSTTLAMPWFKQCVESSIIALLHKESLLLAEALSTQENTTEKQIPHGLIIGEQNDFLLHYLMKYRLKNILSRHEADIVSLFKFRKSVHDTPSYGGDEDFWQDFTTFMTEKVEIMPVKVFYEKMHEVLAEMVEKEKT